MDISQRIKVGRAAAGLSQRELAKKLGVAGSAVAQWETGATMPSIPNRVDLARVLNIKFLDMVPEFHADGPKTVTDPQILIIVRQLESFPAPMREAILMQIAATAEMLDRRIDRDRPAA
jgi:transcriptional regulator with XRE-family HTH domain